MHCHAQKAQYINKYIFCSLQFAVSQAVSIQNKLREIILAWMTLRAQNKQAKQNQSKSKIREIFFQEDVGWLAAYMILF